MTFHQPASGSDGDRIDWKQQVGRLVLVWAHEQVTGIETAYGETDAIRADIVVLDDPAGPARYDDTLIFPRVLQSQLKVYIGDPDPALGRVELAAAQPGRNPAYRLADFTDQDATGAERWLQANKPKVNRPARTTQPAPAEAPRNGVVPHGDLQQARKLIQAGLTDQQISKVPDIGLTVDDINQLREALTAATSQQPPY
jgi:hypothetical protein